MVEGRPLRSVTKPSFTPARPAPTLKTKETSAANWPSVSGTLTFRSTIASASARSSRSSRSASASVFVRPGRTSGPVCP